MKTMLLPVQLLLLQQTTLWDGLKDVASYLQGPTLIYHDGSGDIEAVVQSLTPSRAVIVARVPERPSSNFQRTPRSTVLLAKSPEPLIPSLRAWPLWSARSRVVVVVERGADVRAWLHALWRWTRAVDVVVMVIGDSPEFYTWFPYQPLECSNVTTITKLNSSDLYPIKTGPPLNNCPLVAVTSKLSAIVIDDFNGLEPRLYQDLARKLHLSATYARLPEHTVVWEFLNDEGKAVNGLKMLWENEIDILFSNMARSLRTERYADFLVAHTTDPYIFYVPGPRPMSRASAIYRAFSPNAWVAVLFASSVIFFVLSVISLLEGGGIRYAALETVAISLGVPSHLPASRILQMFALTAYIYSMHITTAYQSSFIIFLSDVPREKPIKTLEELAMTNLTIEFHSAHREAITALSNNPIIATLNRPQRSIYSYYLDLELVAAGKNALLGPKLAFTFSLGIYRDLYYDEFEHPLVQSLPKEPIFFEGMCFFTSKGHPLQPLLDRYTLYLIEAGLPLHYINELSKPPVPVKRHREPFSLRTVEGPFILYSAMLLVCFTAFFTELAVHVWKN